MKYKQLVKIKFKGYVTFAKSDLVYEFSWYNYLRASMLAKWQLKQGISDRYQGQYFTAVFKAEFRDTAEFW